MLGEEKLEVVRRIYDAASRRDSAAVLTLYDPDVELDNSRLGVMGLSGEGRGTYHGHEGLRRFFRHWHEAWESISYDYDELIDAGGDQVVAVVTRHGRGRVSGVEVEKHVALLWTIRDGRATKVVWFLTPEEALEAAGASA
jgi:ketosteroid isomerase-like protein